MEKFFTQIGKFVTIPNLDELIEEIIWTPATDPETRRLQQWLRRKLTALRHNDSVVIYRRGDLQLSGMMWLLVQLRKGGVCDCSNSLMAETFTRPKSDLPDFNEQMKFYLQQFSTHSGLRAGDDKLLLQWLVDRCSKYRDCIVV